MAQGLKVKLENLAGLKFKLSTPEEKKLCTLQCNRSSQSMSQVHSGLLWVDLGFKGAGTLSAGGIKYWIL